MGVEHITFGGNFPEAVAPLSGFFLFFGKPFFQWNFSWRLAFLIGIIGFTMGMFLDRGLRGSE